MVCKKCGKDLPDNALFCGYCGGCVGRVCKVCGARLKQDMQYCPECGTAIENNAEIKGVEPNVPIEDKVSGDGTWKLILLILIGIFFLFLFWTLVEF